jgi:hypothetical protein
MMQKLGSAHRSSDANQPTRPPSAATHQAIRVPKQCTAIAATGRTRLAALPLRAGIGVRHRRAEQGQIHPRLRPELARSRGSFRPLRSGDQSCGTGTQHSIGRPAFRRNLATVRGVGLKRLPSAMQRLQMPRICTGADFVLIRLHQRNAAPISISVTSRERLGRSMVEICQPLEDGSTARGAIR